MTLLAIDGNSILNRAYYGVRPLTNSTGIPTNAVYGFMNIILPQIDALKPDALVVAFDLPEKTFRHKAADSYKATRKGMPDDLATQLPYTRDLLTALGAHVLTCSGYEADDILGTIAKTCRENSSTCVILTGDRDSLQLVNDAVTVALATNRETIAYTPSLFREEYHFSPRCLIDYKALMGDTSDNIAGVSGIGKKTASTLITEWGTIENLYANLETAKLTASVKNKLIAGRESAFQSKYLATIVQDAPIDTDLEHYKTNPIDRAATKAILQELELSRLIHRLGLDNELTLDDEPETPETVEITYHTAPLTATVLDNIPDNSPLPALLLRDDILSYYLNDTVYTTTDPTLITRALTKPHITFASKPNYHYLALQGYPLVAENPPARDVEILAYLLNTTGTSYAISSLAQTYHTPYATDDPNADLVALPTLYDTLWQRVKDEEMTALASLEFSLTVVLTSMEHTGILIDPEGVRAFGEMLDKTLDETRELIYAEAGHEFNIASPKQLGIVLFEEMGLPHGKKTKTGYSTNADILEKLAPDYPIVTYVLQWRQNAKLRSTYVDGLLQTIADDGRIHTTYQQTLTRTGRISSTEPNLQNIPTRTPLGKNMRRFFVAPSGRVLIDADYSQIELRLLANLSGDTAMQEAFASGEDIHRATAAQVFNLPLSMITPDMRNAAKAVNFGIMYGIGAYSLSQDIHVSMYKAKQYIENYQERFPRVTQFMKKTVDEATKNGYVTTYFHRRRPVPELTASNKKTQAAGVRIARNTPIQGTAADIIKMAMVRVYNRLREQEPEARLILQVHDELIVEAPEESATQIAQIMVEEMESVVRDAVPEGDFPTPLTAQVHMGKSWYEAKG